MSGKFENATRRITHLWCRRTSYHPQDVIERYCAFCNRVHEDGETLIEVKGQLQWTEQEEQS